MSIVNRIQNDWNRSQEKCYHCGKIYIQRTQDQIPGFRDREYDVCPYCHEENGSSMEVEYFNTKLEDD